MPRVVTRPDEAEREPRSGLLATRVSRLSIAGWILLTAAIVAMALGVGSWWTYGRGGQVPPVDGYYAGKQVLFIHTEASDAAVAKMLTGMKRSPVVFVPELADVLREALANVYVFTNGVKGGGPFGFQPDVFDSSPRDASYSPLRRLNLVTWQKGARERTLKSVEEIRTAERQGEIETKRPGIVVNMPMVRWPGGER